MKWDELGYWLNRELGLVMPEEVSEETILQALRLRVSELLQKDAGSFFQLMYRLDIPEAGIEDALKSDDVVDRVAQLIFSRQMEKLRTRAQYRSQGDVKDDELQW